MYAYEQCSYNVVDRPALYATQRRIPETLLHNVFGLPGFRGEQQAIISHVIAGDDAIVLMPTGGGQIALLPAALASAANGVGVVVSPLIALMRNQVAALRQLGINAAALNSSLDAGRARRGDAPICAPAGSICSMSPPNA